MRADINKAKYYRREIDGLRAVAVVLVLLYHANISLGGVRLFPAGYIGVDVFFVISGYLITSILYREINLGVFSIVAFYERRARRILPALFSVLFLTSVAAWLWLLPKALIEYAESVVSTLLFGANVYFWKYKGLYTAEVNEFLPLLHMWSLAVEEQFYLLYPPILFWVVFRFKRWLGFFLGTGIIVSLMLSEWASFNAYSANFYLMPTRSWELFAGAVLALYVPGRLNRPMERWLPSVGLLMIVSYAVLFDDSVRHPSFLTLLPIFGSMMIIAYANDEDPMVRLLSSRGFVFTGLISYSLYLWHQPVFVFFRLLLNRELHLAEIGCAFILTVVLSLGSYYLIERPTRNRALVSKKGIGVITCAGCILFLVMALGIISYKGVPSRFPHVSKILSMIDSGLSRAEWTFDINKSPMVFKGDERGRYSLFAAGDSHLETLNAPIIDRIQTLGYFSDFTPLSKGSTMYLPGLDLADPRKPNSPLKGLVALNEKRKQIIMQAKNPIVLIGGRLPYYLNGESFDNQEGGVEMPKGKQWFVLPDKPGRPHATFSDVEKHLQDGINDLLQNGVKVVVIYPIPEVGWNVPRELGIGTGMQSEKLPANRKQPLTTSKDVYLDRAAQAMRLYDSVPDHPNLLRIYPEKLFCGDSRCFTHDATNPYYFDSNHLSYVGASKLIDRILLKMEKKWSLHSR